MLFSEEYLSIYYYVPPRESMLHNNSITDFGVVDLINLFLLHLVPDFYW
jgi:hypothetical protein